MHIDKYGLPVNINDDGTQNANDQLQRVGMLLVVARLNPLKIPVDHLWPLVHGASVLLQPSPGVFARRVHGNPDNVSADQLIGILSGLVCVGYKTSIGHMFAQMLKRGGFAQNVVDGLNGDNTTKKTPDFMLFRAMPLFCRGISYLSLLRYIFDLYLIVLVLGDWVYFKRDKDPADVNNTLATIAVCREVQPSLISMLATWLWPKLCPGIYTRLERYHRAEAGGNPEVALVWKAICQRLRLI